jgi:mitochondrial fission protein ELM1
MPALEAEMNDRPEIVVLGVPEGTTPDPRPPVRIFLGSEPAQRRAERVFVWSIARLRNPARVIEIHLMKRLAGFRSRGWTTGFTNYRFAIPHFAGGEGRAIYNDVDQIYLADPAELFDADMRGAGVLSISPADPSVMLIDCARMAGVWTLEAARREHKRRLVARAQRVPGLIGALPPEWNARDGEYRRGRSKLLHYTTLHTQPWRPFPERFVYQENEHADLWHALERSADDAGFQVFTRARPSRRHAGWAAGLRGRPLDGDALDAAPEADVPWLLDELFASARAPLRIRFERGARRPAERSPGWWSERFESASARQPCVRWELCFHGRSGPVALREGGPRPDGRPPSVWVLADDRPGNTSQSIGLAEALGWPTEIKQLRLGAWSLLNNRLLGASRRGADPRRSSPLEPPWPDLVIAAGRRTAPVALWVREQSLGRTRLVQLGRKGGDAAELFDLVVTPSYCRLFPHPRRIETSTALHKLNEARLAEAAARWKERLEAAPAPRIALLVGGTSGQYTLDVAGARRLGEDVMRLAREVGASVFATTSRRVSPRAGDALVEALAGAAYVHRWAPDDTENPYMGFLALADAIVVTGDSEAMLAEATTVGRPVYVYPLPVRWSFRALNRPREWTLQRARARPQNRRGTVRPQRGLEYWCARLIDRGFVRPTRDLDRLHERLVRLGVARRFGAPFEFQRVDGLREGHEVAQRVRALMGEG